MYEDSHLESDYEDKYTTQADYDMEDKEDFDDETDEEYDSPSLEDMGIFLGSYAS